MKLSVSAFQILAAAAEIRAQIVKSLKDDQKRRLGVSVDLIHSKTSGWSRGYRDDTDATSRNHYRKITPNLWLWSLQCIHRGSGLAQYLCYPLLCECRVVVTITSDHIHAAAHCICHQSMTARHFRKKISNCTSLFLPPNGLCCIRRWKSCYVDANSTLTKKLILHYKSPLIAHLLMNCIF